ncbi:MAG: DUF5615 family PIN-like protein [Pirellulales bacterium]
MLGFYVDHQFQASVTRGLRRRGIDVMTTLDDGNEKLDDELLLTRATELARVLVTHDKDFLRIGARWQQTRQEFAGIAFAPKNRSMWAKQSNIWSLWRTR